MGITLRKEVIESSGESEDSFRDATIGFEEAMDTGSVDSEKLLAEGKGKEEFAETNAVNRENSGNVILAPDQSFQSEAVGSGEIAEAVGATLDLVAGMISDMLVEADSPSKKASTDEKEVASTKVEVEASNNVEELPSTEQHLQESDDLSTGSLILEQEESESPREENGWEVIGTEDDKMSANRDDDIARAAGMLGSALFNSEMKGSGEDQENISTLSDSLSIPSTVPSLAVGALQRSRWSVQLSKLRELGFDDEAQCVEVLERLQAANIGVDSDDDVSVTQVVNAILEQQD